MFYFSFYKRCINIDISRSICENQIALEKKEDKKVGELSFILQGKMAALW